MINWIKKYWIELIVFGVISGVLINACAPSATWVNTDSDGIHYVYSAKYMYPAHKQSAPLYLIISHLFLYLPFGTEFWRMALISVLSGIVGSIFIYLIIKEKLRQTNWVNGDIKSKFQYYKYGRWYGLIGSLIYGGSALAISQNTIVESYPLVATFCIIAYYFCVKQKWLLASLFIGFGIAIHPTSLIIYIPMIIAFKELRNWKRLVTYLPFFLFYLYVPLTNRPPYMWHLPKGEGGEFGFVGDAVSTIQMLFGGIAMPDLPKRILDTIGLVLLNFAVIGVIPLFYAFKKKEWWKNHLLWLVLIPFIYYIVSLAPQVYVYCQFGIAFGAIAIGVGLTKVNRKLLYSIGFVSIVLLSINAWYFDIGKNLDPNLSATKYYKEELAKVPDGEILMPYYGWEWAAIYPYNKNENRNIVPVCMDTLVSPDYQKMLTQQGIKFEDDNNEDRISRQNFIANSIIELNENVWTTVVTDAETYGCEVVPASFDLINKVPTEPPGMLHWKPSNPWKITDGSLEINEWRFITLTNRNAMFYSALGACGFGFVLILFKMFGKRKDKIVINNE